MKQLIQNFKTGELYVDNLPLPSVITGYVLVANYYSLISAGTEKTTITTARASLIGKAKMRPDLVKQVIQNYKKEGFKATLEKVKTKLDSLKALGYSSAGIVLASMDTDNKYKPGDMVACAGAGYASHAEVISVPQNLIAKIPDNVNAEEACYTTLGAIALQGVRQADPKIGDNICVIGLGLLGQITCQLLRANGCNVFGIDVSKRMVELANSLNVAKAFSRDDINLISAIENFTKGYGFDKVIITASSQTSDPVSLSGMISRKKGVVIVVGAVKMDIPRDPDFYQKELELKLSCSYGPGRYDVNYEEQGIDYPYGYVRWTEQRNMEAFLQLLAARSINLKALTTHVFNIDDAVKAYDLILGKTKETFVGILLKYTNPHSSFSSTISISNKALNLSGNKTAFIGAGSFAQSYLIPNIKNLGLLDTVVTRNGLNAKNVAQKFGFINASTDADNIFKNNSISTVFIATQHDTHAQYIIKGLESKKHVFVEKPMAMNTIELDNIRLTVKKSLNNSILVGFNRRFSDCSIFAKQQFNNLEEPLVMNFRINAGFIPKDHWTQTPSGGGRIIGEMCHFIDLMQFFTDSAPIKVFAQCISSSNNKIKNDDNLSVIINFSDGSIGNLIYVANGDKSLPKEYIEIFGGNMSVTIDDFKECRLYKNNKVKKVKLYGKGHKQEVEAFYNSISKGLPMPIEFDSMCITTLTTFKITESLYSGIPQDIQL